MMLLYLTNAFMLVFSKTPLMMAFIVLLQAMLIAFSIYIYIMTSWFSFILFLVFISAMMVVYVYVASLASNDYLYFTSQPVILMMLLAPLLMLLNTQYNFLPNPSSLITGCELDLTTTAVYKMYSPYITITALFLILYLLIALVVVVKITSNYNGPLRATSL